MSDFIDEVFEADCPQYVDFNEPQPLQDNADEWFNYDHENGIPVEFSSSPEHMDTEVKSSSSEDETVAAPIDMEDLTAPSPAPVVNKKPTAVPAVLQNNLDMINISAERTPDTKPAKGLQFVKPTNMVSSWDDNKTTATCTDAKTTTTVPAQKKPLVNPVLPNNTKMVKKDESKSSLVRGNSMRRTTRSVGGITPLRSRSQKRRSGPVNTPATKRTASADSSRISRATKRHASADSSIKRTHHMANPVPTKRKRRSSPAPAPSQQQKPKLTLPHTPQVLSRNIKSGQPKFKSSEEIELERIEKKRIEANKLKELSKKSMQQSLEALSYLPVKSAVMPTRPEGFKFETDSRIKEHPMETRQDGLINESNFQSGLRKHKPSPKKQRGPTRPKPFHFHEMHRNNNAAAPGKAGKFNPMAQAISQFHSKTPDRFRTKAAKDVNKGPCPVKAVHTKPALTCPKTPCLETKSRKRPNTAISQREKEEMEYKELKSYSFKAREIDPRVMSNMNVGVTKPQPKEATKVVEFDLECNKRFREREANKKPQEEEKHEFHARPLPSKIMEGPTGIAPAKPLPVTCPKSPAFALKNRVRITRSNASQLEEEPPKIIHANPIPHVGIPFVPNLNHKVTESKPFSFDNRDKEMQARKEAKIQEVINEEKELHSKFRAHELPNFDKPKVQGKKRRSCTVAKPFASVEERGAKQAEKWSKKMEEELNEQRHQASAFKATPADVLYTEPFVPMKSSKPLTDVSEHRLNTDRRSVQRQEFEEKKHIREANLRVADEERQRQVEEEEREGIAILRREMEHKANPIRKFAQVNVHPSCRPLTEPESPHFETNMRLRSQQPRL